MQTIENHPSLSPVCGDNYIRKRASPVTGNVLIAYINKFKGSPDNLHLPWGSMRCKLMYPSGEVITGRGLITV